MPNFTVRLNFTEGAINYNLPLVSEISDPEPGIKDTIIEGIRANGSLRIPGGKKSQIITAKGTLVNHLGYEGLTTDMATLRSSITTNVATLTLKHYNAGWFTDWAYTVVRQGEIRFLQDSLRTDYVEYEVDFLVLVY